MKTKFALMTAVLAFSYAFSQETGPELRVYSRKVDSIVVSEKSKMNKELDELDKKYRDNKISSDEKQKQRTDIAVKYEGIINEKVSAQKDQLEIATKEIVKDAVMRNTKKQSIEVWTQNNAIINMNTAGNTTRKDLLRTNDFNISFACINLTNSSSSLAIGNKESGLSIGNSLSSQMEFRITRQIGSLVSPVFYRIGFGYRYDSFSPKKPDIFSQEQNELYISEFNDFAVGSLKRSYLKNHYFVVPIDFVFVLNPKYTVENSEEMLDNSKRNFRISAGIYGGVRFLSQNYVIYKNEENNRIKYRENIPDAANAFLFGGKLSFGYGPINIFVKKDFTPLFNDHAKFNNKYGVQIGLELLYVNF